MKNHPHILIKDNFKETINELSVCLFVCLSVCLSVCQFVCLFVCLFACLFSSDLISTCPMLSPFPSCRFAAGCPSPVHPHGYVTVNMMVYMKYFCWMFFDLNFYDICCTFRLETCWMVGWLNLYVSTLRISQVPYSAMLDPATPAGSLGQQPNNRPWVHSEVHQSINGDDLMENTGSTIWCCHQRPPGVSSWFLHVFFSKNMFLHRLCF